MENTIENAIRFLLDNHKHETYDSFVKTFTKKEIGSIMVNYAEQISKACDSTSADLKEKFLLKVEQIAQTYHDRLCFSSLTMEGQVCKCCESVVSSTISIEYDSQDYSKDLNICDNCYSHIVIWWKNNKPRKIAPI